MKTPQTTNTGALRHRALYNTVKGLSTRGSKYICIFSKKNSAHDRGVQHALWASGHHLSAHKREPTDMHTSSLAVTHDVDAAIAATIPAHGRRNEGSCGGGCPPRFQLRLIVLTGCALLADAMELMLMAFLAARAPCEYCAPSFPDAKWNTSPGGGSPCAASTSEVRSRLRVTLLLQPQPPARRTPATTQ